MKKVLLLLSGTFLYCGISIAQPVVNATNASPVKLSDVIEKYKKEHEEQGVTTRETDDETDAGNSEKEGGEYFYNRWLWYWKQHLDQDGYMVSPIKTWQEWQTYLQNNTLNNTAAKTTGNNAQWVFEGTDSSGANGSGVGRINVVTFDPVDSNTFWIGSPGGGAWKTTNKGTTWTCMTDQNPLIAVSDIAINPLNANTVYLCTGDVDGGDYYSIGVLKSYDGGQSWSNIGPAWTTNNLREANSMVINPLDTNTIIMAASDGIRRSTNGGTTWTIVAGGYFKQVLYNPSDTNVLYAVTYLQPGSSGSPQIFRSANGGLTWTSVMLLSGATRIALAVTNANAAVVKAVAAKESDYSLFGIYGSTDTGKTFTVTYKDSCNGANSVTGRPNILGDNTNGSDCTYGQGWYDLCIAINPTNANNVFVGGINTWYSTNGGTSWTISNHGYGGSGAKVHPDKHCLKFNPLNSHRLYEGNDGGIYWSDNASSSTSTWNNATNGLGVTEFYRVAVSGVATYEVAGAQDVGCKYVQNKKYKDANGGDGMECQMDYADSTVYYCESEYGAINRHTLAGASTAISNNIPYLANEQAAAGWVTPYIIEPTCHTCLLAGFQRVYKSTNEGTTWTPMGTAALTTDDLLRVVTTLADSNTIYALDDGQHKAYFTHNGGTTWGSINTRYSGSPSDIKADPHNKNRVWITYSGYGGGSVAEFDSSNTTSIPPYWTSMTYNLPLVPVNCIEIDTSNMSLYIGTDVGVFYKDTTMSDWQAYNTGMPVVRVDDIQINYAKNEVWAATYGRSLWKSPKQTGFLGVSIVPFALNSLIVSPNPNHGSFTINVTNNVPDNEANVRIMDMTGRVAWSGNTSINNSKILINTEGIARGNYIIEVSSSGAVIGRNKIVIY